MNIYGHSVGTEMLKAREPSERL